MAYYFQIGKLLCLGKVKTLGTVLEVQYPYLFDNWVYKSIHLLLLKISMRRLSLRCKEPEIWAVVVAQFAEHLLSLTTFKKCLLGRSRSYFCELFFWWISDQQ